ncbi:MAG: molybdopterin biosynthesis protein [Ruminococcaceae bacterium]|mgnify:CR=1 FL=1|nr:molybdopterin biosynthesis protein [Oscillospiraceae bacterium]
MKYEYLTNTDLDKAVNEYITVLKAQGLAPKAEIVPVAKAAGRVTAKAVYANICAPHYNASAMDGIALMAQITFGATETTPVRLKNTDFIQVDTGDKMPDGTDAVVMIEDVVRDGDDVLLFSAAVPWQHVRQVGEDICAGDMILPSYTEITPAALGAMLAGGVLTVDVVKAPIIGIIPTGDEIIPPCENPESGKIIEFNSTIFSGILFSWGAIPKTYEIVKDVKEDIISAVKTATEECDAVIINAGSSAGRDDYTNVAVSTVGEILYHGIAIKPGKPAILGYAKDKPLLGVPGYPVSGIIVLEQIMKPVIEIMTGKNLHREEKVVATLGRVLTSSLKYREFIRVRLGVNETGEYIATPLNRGAGVVTSFVKADGIIDVPQDCEGYEAGDKVEVTLLRPRADLDDSLTIIGSHDPLIDEVIDILKIKDKATVVSSSHVGSMGAIMALKRKEAQMGGIHLLDEKTGEYNISYIQQHFPNGGVTLIKGVKRVQGIMVAKGNPKNIKDFSDMTREDISYVNRQKGSGTRILCDFLIKEKGINSKDIYGYDREEFTHTSVAAQIATGTADAGLGIFSAAKIYGLDFIPICNEEYDLLVDDEALNTDKVQNFISVLKSDELKKRLAALGGYEVY